MTGVYPIFTLVVNLSSSIYILRIKPILHYFKELCLNFYCINSWCTDIIKNVNLNDIIMIFIFKHFIPPIWNVIIALHLNMIKTKHFINCNRIGWGCFSNATNLRLITLEFILKCVNVLQSQWLFCVRNLSQYL